MDRAPARGGEDHALAGWCRCTERGHRLHVDAEEVPLGHAGLEGLFQRGQSRFGQGHRHLDARQLVRRLLRPQPGQDPRGVDQLEVGHDARQDLGEEGRERVGADPVCLGEPGDTGQGGDEVRRVPEHAVEVVVADLGWDPVVPGREQVDPTGLGDDDAEGGEGVGPGSPQLAGPGGVADVAGTAEHERIEAGALRRLEHAAAALLAEPGEIDAGAVLEGHGPGHATTSKGS